MGKVHVIYDAKQHCKATREKDNKTVSMDCPYTGKGEEFSPGNLLESAVGGCMLISMGTLAMRNDIDITGTRIDVSSAMTETMPLRIAKIEIEVIMPRSYDEKSRTMLEKAAASCPIKNSFGADTAISVRYKYPGL